MKKKILLFVTAVTCSVMSFAQMGPVSLGLELAKPLGDFGEIYPVGIGLSAGYEHPVSDNIGITAQLGWMMLVVDGDISRIDKASMMPIQAGVKYYFDEFGTGFYAHGQIGIHSMTVTIKEIEVMGVMVGGGKASDSNLSFALGAGYMLTEKLDLGLRFNIISGNDGGSASNYLGVRLAYSLFGGE